jgi:hypothetical protein
MQTHRLTDGPTKKFAVFEFAFVVRMFGDPVIQMDDYIRQQMTCRLNRGVQKENALPLEVRNLNFGSVGTGQITS